MEKVVLMEKFRSVTDYWHPKIVGELNGQHVRICRVKGDFFWHHHEDEDEMFLVLRGTLTIRLRDKDIVLNQGEFFIVPKGVEHQPCAEDEVDLLLFEPASTLNTGNLRNEGTHEQLEKI